MRLFSKGQGMRKGGRAPALALAAMILFLTACGGGHKRTAKYRYPAPLPPTTTASAPAPKPPPKTAPPVVAQQPKVPEHAKVIAVEEGMASWYGAPYHNRRAANGEIYDMNAFTAAHLTLPLNSIVRVTNLKTGSSAVVRITDRGPFVDNRIIDLSVAAAKALDVWRPGTARVKLEVLEAPAAIDRGGRWAVQLGGFDQHEADLVKAKLAQRFENARVQEFPSPVGDWWVRVRVPNDDKGRAEEVARETPAPKSNTFLVRLD